MFSPHSISMLSSKLLWILTCLMFPWSLFLILTNKTILFEWEFSSFLLSPLTFSVLNDPKSALFSCAVFLISANVLHFSNSYMKTDMFVTRFTILVLMFIISMNLLLFLPNMMALLLGWDGLGLTSFLLVIYYQGPASWGAAMITALSNRIGDVMILLSIGWSLNQGHWNIMNMQHTSMSMFMIVSIMIAAMTKSAQMPFSAWLPAAMAAPTPVSALVHSSTLVTAGVFLLLRFYPFLSALPLFNTMITLIASLTMFMASIAALMENDMKKIIALSTLSQLGIMMATIGLNMPILAFFHLLTHALFKALLFICAGTMINYFHHTQDLRQMGNNLSQMPLTTSAIMTANLALTGTPYLAGFYSKDLILEFSLYSSTNMFIIFLLMISTIMTTAYSLRFMYITIWSPNMHGPLHNINNNDNNFTIPSFTLATGAIAAGAIMNWFLVSPFTEPVLSPLMKTTPLLMFFFSLIITWVILTSKTTPLKMKLKSLITAPKLLLMNEANSLMWFLNPLSTFKSTSILLPLSFTLLKTVDHGWVETFSSKGLKTLILQFTSMPQFLQANTLTSHLLLSLTLLCPLLIFL